MKFIYDILLNFGDAYYEFYDWNKDDKLLHIRKTPIFKVNETILRSVLNNVVKTDMEFLKKIKNRTEAFTKRNIELFEYICLLCSDNKVLGIKLDSTGKVISKSDLLVDEHDDVLTCTHRYPETEFNVVILEKEETQIFKTRYQNQIEKFIFNEVDKQTNSKLKYILYECFNEVCDDRDTIIDKLTKEMSIENSKKIYGFLKMNSVDQKKV